MSYYPPAYSPDPHGIPGPYYPYAPPPTVDKRLGGWALGLAFLPCVPFATCVSVGLGITAIVRSKNNADYGRKMGIWALVVDGIFIVATIAYLTVNVVQSGSPLGRPSPTSSATATAPVTDTAPPTDVQPGQCVIDHQLEKVPAPGEEVSIDTVEVVPTLPRPI